ncbi:MAG: hypothetical protein JWQ78_755, partial [Sediminibacterium sp.]|nr:hypothetical protein [Sediminibacterium sp.]
VRFIANGENRGFARANNQALPFCSGDYVLFLNPDTLVPEDALHACLDFIRGHPSAGAVGVRMLDGRGRFLPESKRAFPSPRVSFYKMVGLAALFPASAVFNQYALGHLDDRSNHVVDVLAGAFLLADRSLLASLNGFDESYFMYGEDIDLSYRIRMAGRENHYFAGTSIIHFKGESSRRGGLAHVRLFYGAMQVFVRQHYQTGSTAFSYFIRVAISFRALAAVLHRLIRPVMMPLADTATVWVSLQLVRWGWVSGIRNGRDFNVPFTAYGLPLLAGWFVASAAFMGLYDKGYKVSRTLPALVLATVSMLAAYSLLPESIRFSRAVILFGGLLGSAGIFGLRQWLASRSHSRSFTDQDLSGEALVVASETEYAEVAALLENVSSRQNLLGRISPGPGDANTVGTLTDLPWLAKKLSLEEIIFCAGTVSLRQIIGELERLKSDHLHALFHMQGSQSIVGSDTHAATSKTLAANTGYRLADPHQRRMKRTVDLFVALFFIIGFPVHVLYHQRIGGLLKNAVAVLMGRRTWIGYIAPGERLPPLRKGIITHLGKAAFFDAAFIARADHLYARNYDWWQDAVIVFRHYPELA